MYWPILIHVLLWLLRTLLNNMENPKAFSKAQREKVSKSMVIMEEIVLTATASGFLPAEGYHRELMVKEANRFGLKGD